jgi:hypothetical protein
LRPGAVVSRGFRPRPPAPAAPPVGPACPARALCQPRQQSSATSGRAACATASTSLSMGTRTWSWPSRFRGCRRLGGRYPTRRRRPRATVAPTRRSRRHCDAHAGRARARHLRPARPPPGVRVASTHARLPAELPLLRHAAPPAAHGVQHVLPRRPGRPGGIGLE